MIICPKCKGNGKWVKWVSDGGFELGHSWQVPAPCPQCDGTGQVKEVRYWARCENCNGYGRVNGRIIGHYTSGKPVYDEVLCPKCKGTGKEERTDYEPDYTAYKPLR